MQNQIPKNWQKVKLGDISNLITRGFQPSYTDNEGVVVVNQKCVRYGKVNLEDSRMTDPNKKNISTDKYLKPFDILINSTGTGTVGRVGRLDNIHEPLTFDSHLTLVRPNLEKVDGKYLGHLLFKLESYLENLADGSTNQVELSRDRIKNLEIELPPLVDQREIASILSAFDDKIEVNDKIAKTLEEMAQALFKEWFVNFKFPGYEKVEFVESELGKIPEGWKIGILADIVNIRNGFAFKSGDYKDEGIPVIRTMNFTDNESVVLDDIVYLSKVNAKNYENFYLEKFDLLLVMVGASIGKYVLVPSNVLPALQNQNMWDFKPKKEDYRFFNIQLLRRLFKQQRNSATGSARDFFRKDYFYSLNTFIPDEEIIKKFNLVVEPIYEKMDRTLGENQKLAALRDLLLPKLMRGEISV